MTVRPPLVRSIPFWALAVASLASIGVGAWILSDRLGLMATALTDGTATGVEVYVGQSLSVVGAALVGAGVVGVLLVLAVATAASLRPVPATEVVDPIDWDDETIDEQPVAEDVVIVDAAPDARTDDPEPQIVR